MLVQLNWIFLFLALLTEILGTIGGFGSSVFFVPIANFYFDFQSVLGLTALFHLSSNLSKIAFFRKGVEWSLVLKLGLPAIVMVVLGGFLSNVLNGKGLEIGLGTFLVALSLAFMAFPKFRVRKGTAEALTGGAASGFFAGLLGTGGAIRGLTMAAFNLEKHMFIATSAFIDLGVDLSRTFVYISNGYVHTHDLIYIPFLFVIGVLGTFLGKKALQYIPQKTFRWITLTLILTIGIITLISALSR